MFHELWRREGVSIFTVVANNSHYFIKFLVVLFFLCSVM